MRLLRSVIILLLLAFGAFYVLDMYNTTPKEAAINIGETLKSKTSQLEAKTVPDRPQSDPDIKLDGKLFQWIGKDKKQLIESLGEPTRKDLSAYGYKWWVYTDGTKQYVQFGVSDDLVTTVYAIGKGLSTKPIQLGQAYKEVNKRFPFKNEITLKQGGGLYTFKLNEKDLKTRSLVKLSDNVFLQCYFDTFTSELSAIRVLTGDVLLKQRPYGLVYRGNLPASPSLTDDKWKKIESGMEKQIFAITNVIRNKHGKSKLKWEDTVSEAAFLHSKDMAINNYFSHYAPNGDSLKERLAAKEVYYLSAGGNIAARYPDAPAAMQGWLNSEGHRKALLENDYTHLGVGVYHFYYTQNFLQKPM